MSGELLDQAARIAVPYGFAALGGVLSERAGVVNIALEGLMLTGAFTFVAGTLASGSPWVGVAAAMAAGALLASVHAVLALVARAPQIVSGVALNLLAIGATDLGTKLLWQSSANSPRVAAFGGPLGHPLLWIALATVPALHVLLRHTRPGLRLRAAGERPEALEAAGVSVIRVRAMAIIGSGVLAGLGGAHLASEQALFTSGMTAGRGYVALAAVIVGKWTPVGAALAALFFGLAETVEIQVQARTSLAIPAPLVEMLPYVLTLLVLCGLIGRARPPGALGTPYERERPT